MTKKALTAVIQEAGVQGNSTRSVDDQVKAMGTSGSSKSQVSRLCEEIDGKVRAFLNRPLEGDWPCLWIDATYLKVRLAGGSSQSGLRGVKLVISDAHEGIKAAVSWVLCATWQRCRVGLLKKSYETLPVPLRPRMEHRGRQPPLQVAQEGRRA